MPGILVFLLLAASCSSVQNQAGGQGPSPRDAVFNLSVEEALGGDHWITWPGEGGIPIIGIADRTANWDKAIADAVADAARKASLYHGVSGEVASVYREGSNALDYYAGTDYRLTLRNNPESYIDALAFDPGTDVLEKNGSVYVRTRYPAASPIPAYASALREGVPDWVKTYKAEIPGFLTGIGISNNRGSPQKTCRASYENAVVSLLAQQSTRIGNYQLDTGEKGYQSGNVSVSSGTLTKVMILETWFDTKTGSVWTLIAAPEPERPRLSWGPLDRPNRRYTMRVEEKHDGRAAPS